MLGTFPNHSEAKRIIIDIETYDPTLSDKGASHVYNTGYILGVGIKLDNLPAEYYPLRHQGEQNYEVDAIYRYLHSVPVDCTVVGQYFVYDAGWLKYESGWLHKGPYRDTLLKAQLENNTLSSYSLNNLGRVYGLGEKSDINMKHIHQMPIPWVARYCCNDVELTAKVDNATWKYNGSEALNRECALIPILVRMKEKGIRIDIEKLYMLQSHYNQLLDDLICDNNLTDDIWSAAAVAPMFHELKIDYPRTARTGKPSFPRWFLEGIPHPRVQGLFKARHIDKLIQFCLGISEHLDREGRIHPDFFNGKTDYGGTITGRFSSGHPNVQQQPNRTEEGKMLRSLFIPDEGNILYKFDYKQQEPILWMHYASKLGLSGIQRWQDLYKSEDADFYTPIMESMKIERFPAKTITLAAGYGMGYEKLSRMNHVSLTEAQEYLVGYRRTVPWLYELKDHCSRTAATRGFIHTIGGRNLYFNRASASDAFNHLIQGSAADQIKEAMVDITFELNMIPLLQVHDELLCELNMEDINQRQDVRIKELMEAAIELNFPTRVEVKPGLNWQQCG